MLISFCFVIWGRRGYGNLLGLPNVCCHCKHLGVYDLVFGLVLTFAAKWGGDKFISRVSLPDSNHFAVNEFKSHDQVGFVDIQHFCPGESIQVIDGLVPIGHWEELGQHFVQDGLERGDFVIGGVVAIIWGWGLHYQGYQVVN